MERPDPTRFYFFAGIGSVVSSFRAGESNFCSTGCSMMGVAGSALSLVGCSISGRMNFLSGPWYSPGSGIHRYMLEKKRWIRCDRVTEGYQKRQKYTNQQNQ
ncbi:MAG: hypothetical protein LAP40_14115 [Acidobacteriia bacterium]|nr:hypothetical protein [Terriglobia bacterium]